MEIEEIPWTCAAGWYIAANDHWETVLLAKPPYWHILWIHIRQSWFWENTACLLKTHILNPSRWLMSHTVGAISTGQLESKGTLLYNYAPELDYKWKFIEVCYKVWQDLKQMLSPQREIRVFFGEMLSPSLWL